MARVNGSIHQSGCRWIDADEYGFHTHVMAGGRGRYREKVSAPRPARHGKAGASTLSIAFTSDLRAWRTHVPRVGSRFTVETERSSGKHDKRLNVRRLAAPTETS